MNSIKLATHVAAITALAALAGCVTSEQQISAAPARPRPAVVAVQAPPPAVVVRAPAPVPVGPPVYVSAPSDVYIAGVMDRDVVFVGGDTYLWVVGPDGRRHRHFYAHGDRRAEVFRRREHLRAEMAHRGGHAPSHAVVAHRDTHAPHRPERREGAPARHGSAEHHRPQPEAARVAEHHGNDRGRQHGHTRPPRVDEAQQQAPHRQGQAG
ncbi:hypothetical protein [Paraburkholderia diazotrophica]|uniref:Uncharacterized protein n=1 Tax=Paraburkholderia diazotrophica TaxID=667676 RepID=A0A1H6SN33_9BURK|nr:hypothetical protein [Paraburkholderia diazotrophica]SEI67314.1 hypothetical protein SAMN05192539_1003234 [Paraburkholderia diazotrophica]